MYDLIRLARLIEELQTHVKALHERSNYIVDGLNKQNAVRMSDGAIISNIINGMSRRIDTLEILASKKYAEEIENPFKGSEDKVGRC